MAEPLAAAFTRSPGPPGAGTPPPHRLRADLLLLVVTLLAAAGWMFSRGALQGLPPLLFLGIRFVLAGLLLAAVGIPEIAGLGRADALRAAGTGVAMGLTVVCWIQGLSRATELGVGAFICSLGVVLIPVVGRMFFRVEVSRRTWIAAAVGTAGLVLLSARRGLILSSSDLFFAASAGASALHFNLNTRFASRMPARALTAVQLTVVGLLALTLSALGEPWPRSATPAVLLCLAASIVLCTSLRFLLQVKAQSLAPVGHAAVLMALEPVWTALLAWAVLGERLARPQLAGCGLIAAALLINRLGPLYPAFVSEEG